MTTKRKKLPTFGAGNRTKSTGQCRTDKQKASSQRRKSKTSPQMKKQLRKNNSLSIFLSYFHLFQNLENMREI